jgi:threonine/homoserine/homoserine lactone efflux protein
MLGFLAIFGGVAGLSGPDQGYSHAATLVLSVLCGSGLWWLGLSQFVSLFRQRMNDRLLEIVNRVSGGLIAVFGAAVLARVVWKFFG